MEETVTCHCKNRIEFTDGTLFSSCLKTSTCLEAKMTRDDGGQPQVLKDYSTPSVDR